MSTTTLFGAPKVLFVESGPFRALVFVTVTATALSLIGHLMTIQAPSAPAGSGGTTSAAPPVAAPAPQPAPQPVPQSAPAPGPAFATQPNTAPAPVQLQGGGGTPAPAGRAAPSLQGTDFDSLR